MGPAEGSDAAAGRVARPGAGGVVSRTGLFERLGASARVTVISAPPGSGKSVLLRSWIGEAGLMGSAGWVSVGRDDRDPQRFSLAEARELFAAARVELPEAALRMLYERTEGWAAGLRLAALSLAGHPNPVRFAAEFSGSERTVADYLLAEVLERQSEEVRRLLLRTSILEQVNGELADLLTGDEGGERVLQELEEANAFVVALDVARSWFRYHHLFADLLQLELRRTASGEIAALHHTAARWYADSGYPMEAIRHAQAAHDWGLAIRLLGDHWPGLQLGGQAATAHAMLAGFPAEARTADAELAALAAADELAQGSLEAAEGYLGVATRGSVSVPAGRQGQLQVLLGVVRLLVARQRGNLPAVI